MCYKFSAFGYRGVDLQKRHFYSPKVPLLWYESVFFYIKKAALFNQKTGCKQKKRRLALKIMLNTWQADHNRFN